MSNRKGFSIAETLILLAIAGLISGIGWYIWSSQNKNNNYSVETSSDSSKSEVWQTQSVGVTGKDPIGLGVEVPFTLQFPPEWEYITAGTKYKSTSGYEIESSEPGLVPPGKKAGDKNLNFGSSKTDKSAADHFKETVTYPEEWKLENFTTGFGYEGLTGSTTRGGNEIYVTIISDRKSAVEFSYDDETSSFFSIYKKIFDAVKLP